jgi:hypothetical protein
MRRPHQHVFNCRGSVNFDVLQISTRSEPTGTEKAMIRAGVNTHKTQRVIQQPGVFTGVEEQRKVAPQCVFFQAPGCVDFVKQRSQRLATKTTAEPQRADATGGPRRRSNHTILDLPLSWAPPGDNAATIPLHSLGTEKPLTLERAFRTGFAFGVSTRKGYRQRVQHKCGPQALALPTRTSSRRDVRRQWRCTTRK